MDRTEIVEKITPQIRRWAKGFVKRNPECAKHFDDLVGEANLKVFSLLSVMEDPILQKFSGKFDKLSTYLRLSTWTAFTDYLRLNGVVVNRTRKVKCEPLKFEPLVEDPSPSDEMNEREVLQKLFEITQDRRDAEILEAKLKGARTGREVSKVTGLSTSTVCRRLRILKSRYKKQ